ncbi:MAG: aminotransferase class III-fold pyridoxal phosphate-dependent enzyme [Deltaproteobacteria bacterium]|nr:aminotransferase class III-fold pyridoxal phosphate-dependent enzyme [Deltaproteobacteria bacterium]
MSAKKDHVLNVFMNREYPTIVKADGIYLHDDQGNKIIDGAGGVIVCNLGHGIDEMADTLRDQAKKAAFVYRIDFSNPPLEEAADKVCELTDYAMDKVFFVSGGSEANEIAVKIARKFHIDNGTPAKHKIISRWLSYHGMTNGALSWGGMTNRRADYIPMLSEGLHIPPAYCYRCWFNQKPDTCALECAQALENEIMCQGPENIAAFIVEPISGNSLCSAVPRMDYFKRIREICDKFDVLLILDEVMTGFGRTGKWFGYEHFAVVPDIMTLGKGLGGGYFPIGAAVTTERIADTIARNSGLFGAGFSWAGNPMACAVASKTIDYLKEHRLVEKSHEMGQYLNEKLAALSKHHPSIGDVRGAGLMCGIEFVKDRDSKQTLDPEFHFSYQLAAECLARGLGIQPGLGCDRGQSGDMILLGPPFIITKTQIDDLSAILDEALAITEKKAGF